MAIRRLSSSGITAGGKSSKIWDQVTSPGSFEAIATAVVDSGGAASVTFSNIPNNYAHLQIRALAKLTTGSNQQVAMQFNGDSTTSNYYFHEIYADGSGAYGNSGNSSDISYCNSTQFGANVIDILDYASVNKFKTSRNLFGFDVNGSGGYAIFRSHLWKNTNAISSITISSPTNFTQYSHFALYGVRGA